MFPNTVTDYSGNGDGDEVDTDISVGDADIHDLGISSKISPSVKNDNGCRECFVFLCPDTAVK